MQRGKVDGTFSPLLNAREDGTILTVRAHCDGETLTTRTFADDREHVADAYYESSLSYWRRQDADRSDGVTVDMVTDKGDVLYSRTFASDSEY